uniref:Metallothionein n=1 Tax=Megathura crenulata TaxID=55429 RepID=Q7YZP1_MEGCR|nr:metallothionein [Megathura crenulata]
MSGKGENCTAECKSDPCACGDSCKCGEGCACTTCVKTEAKTTCKCGESCKCEGCKEGEACKCESGCASCK